jgi:hypothetical protein
MSDFERKKAALTDDKFVLPDAPDEFELAPDERPPVKPPEVQPVFVEEESPASSETNEDRQFSVGELIGLVTFIAVVLSVLSSIAHWMGWGQTPAGMAAVFATVLGGMSLVSMIVLAFLPHARRIVLVGWWVLLGSYIVTAAAAVLMAK